MGVGAVAAATAMALRLNGISHWVMWEMAALFEQSAPCRTASTRWRARPRVVDAPDAQAAARHPRRHPLRARELRLRRSNARRVIDDLDLHIRPGEKIGLVGRSGAGKCTIVNLLLRFYDVAGRPRADRRPGHRAGDAGQPARADRHGDAGHFAAASLGAATTSSTGGPTPRDADMVAAANRAEAHEFIAGLTDPKGRKG